MKKFNEIASMGEGELRHELEKSLKDLQELRVGNTLKQLKETHKIKITRRYIAQLKTAIQQMKNPLLAPSKKETITESVHPIKEKENIKSKTKSTAKKIPTKKVKKMSAKKTIK